MDISSPAHDVLGSDAFDGGVEVSIVAVSNPLADKALPMFILLRDIVRYARLRASLTNCKQEFALYVVPSVPLVHLMHAYIVSSGDIRIKALAEANDQDYCSQSFWDSIRPSCDGIVTTTDILCRLLESFVVDIRVRSLHVWDMCNAGHGVERCFRRIFKWFEVEKRAESQPGGALHADIRTEVGYSSLLMRQVANSTHVGGAGVSTRQISYFPTEDSWLWCSTYLADVLGDLERWTREYVGVVDYNADDDTSASAIIFQRKGLESVYLVPKTGAQLTYQNSVAVLYIYYAWLSAKAGMTLKPEFEFVESGPPSVWHCWMTLPVGTLSLDVHSEGFSTRWLAHHAVVFKACRSLHQRGALDDMLLPNLEWSGSVPSEDQCQDKGEDQDLDFLSLPVARLISDGDATPVQAWSSDVTGSYYAHPIDIPDDPWAPVEMATLPLEEPKPKRIPSRKRIRDKDAAHFERMDEPHCIPSRKRARDQDADYSGEVDSADLLSCPRSVAMGVGSSFIKLAISLKVFTEFPASQQDELTTKRSEEQFFKKIYGGLNKREAMAEVGNEFLRNGIEGGLATANSKFAGFKCFEEWKDFDDRFRKTRAQALDAASRVLKEEDGTVQAVEQLLGYEFQEKRLLVESLTCSSFLPNYNRLEYLGDAVLDLVVASHWARQCPELLPDPSSSLKSKSVSNVALGVMCLRSGLYRHIQYRRRSSPTSTFDSAREMLLHVEKGAAPYLLHFRVPKVLADVVESVFGAVFMDCGCQYGPVHTLFMRLLEPNLRHLESGASGGWRIVKKPKAGAVSASVQ
ncbi:Endoribonuclease Dicer [Dissophora globulifera]|uniref:Endoribonuclease Dicer n=1 Tax=Dissophora globulifera TaxID=979702 RepID=A0A9P6RDJ4_9FUNG|nr:Endoribonuclease Dicer [Dissophora globulifera]